MNSESNSISNNTTGVVAGGITGFHDIGSVISNNADAGIGFISAGGSFSLLNTTVSGNRNRGISFGFGTNAYLSNRTIDGNTTTGNGAGIYVPSDFGGGSAFVQIRNHAADLPAGNLLLGAMVDNAGPIRVKTHALLKGSPAIDKVPPSEVDAIDQRGFPRPTAALSWDVGAYEVMPFETELLSVISSQGWHATQGDASLSNGAGTVMRSGAVGNSVTYAVAVPQAADTGLPYQIELRAKTSVDFAKIELATAPGTNTFTPIDTVDMYTSSAQIKTFALKTFRFTSPGIKHFRLKIIGKNAASTGYSCFYDYIRITNK